MDKPDWYQRAYETHSIVKRRGSREEPDAEAVNTPAPTRPKKPPLTVPEINDIVDRYRKGETVKSISARYDRATATIHNVLTANIPDIESYRRKREITDAEIKKIVKLRRDGLGVRAIAKLLGRSYSGVRRVLVEMELAA